jgi:putative transposase
MPNHVHVLVRPYSDATCPLEAIEQGWKGFSSRAINKALATSGQWWQHESYDRIVRDEEHLWKCLQYIGENPSRARLGPEEARRWVCPL